MKKGSFLIILALAIGSLGFHNQPDPLSNSDGPYIFIKEGQLMAKWIEEGQLKSKNLTGASNLHIPTSICPDFNIKDLRNPDEFPKPQASFPAGKKIAAISDVHGQYEIMIELLQANGIIDQDNNWSFSDGHFVMLGDIFDRGDQVTEILWFLHKLEQQALEAGGKVHVTLGNHEILILNGDLRYINNKYRNTMSQMGESYENLFGPDTYLGKWLRSKPIAISIGDIAFVHGGFSELYLRLNLDFDEVNQIFIEKLIDTDLKTALKDTTLNILYLDYGPIWYRGYFNRKEMTKSKAKKILRKIGKSHIVVGHQSQKEVISLFENRIFGIDSSIKIGRSGQLLLIEGDNFYRATMTGEKILLE